MIRPLLPIALAAALLTACSASPPPASNASSNPDAPKTALGRTVENAMREARKELQTSNISLNDGIRIGPQRHRSDGNLPKAEITPTGDLLIEGRSIAIDPAQRALLLQYRGHVIALAETGMSLGVRGADLGMQAAGDAIGSIFSGNTDQVEQRVEAEAAKLEAEARTLCARLAPMLSTQSALAASLPAFAPYAKMTQADVDECMRDSSTDHRADVRERIREEVRSGIRDGVRGTVGADPAPNAAKDAEAASTPR